MGFGLGYFCRNWNWSSRSLLSLGVLMSTSGPGMVREGDRIGKVRLGEVRLGFMLCHH